MKLRTAAVYLVTLFGACSFGASCVAHRNIRTPAAIVERHVDKSKIELKCDDVARVCAGSSIFYACEGDIDPELLSEMEYVAAVKKHGVEKLGLKPTTNYQIYKNGEDEKPVTWYRLYVTPKTNLPQKWGSAIYIANDGEHKPVIEGAVRFYSEDDQLLDEKKHYLKEGFDVYWRSYTSFVSSGDDDCNLSPEFLEKSAAKQAKTILHEKFHVVTDKESNLEESFAVLVGRAGAIVVTAEHFGENSEEHKEAKENLEYWLNLSKDVIETNSKLLELYKKEMSLEDKLAEKEKILKASKHVSSNAEIWDLLPYTKNFPLVHDIYKKRPNLKELVEIFINCPKTEAEGIEYLKGFL